MEIVGEGSYNWRKDKKEREGRVRQSGGENPWAVHSHRFFYFLFLFLPVSYVSIFEIGFEG